MTNLIELMKDEMLIEEKNGKYYSTCAKGEEITIELNNIIDKLCQQGLGDKK